MKAGDDYPRSIHLPRVGIFKRVHNLATSQRSLYLQSQEHSLKHLSGALSSTKHLIWLLFPTIPPDASRLHRTTPPYPTPAISFQPKVRSRQKLLSAHPLPLTPRQHRIRSHHLPGHLFLSTMCTTSYLKSRACGHAWMTIKRPCAEGKNFSNCASFNDGRARGPPPAGQWATDSCPWCNLKGAYDANTTRVVTKVEMGVRLFGYSASRRSPGLDVVCCAVM